MTLTLSPRIRRKTSHNFQIKNRNHPKLRQTLENDRPHCSKTKFTNISSKSCIFSEKCRPPINKRHWPHRRESAGKHLITSKLKIPIIPNSAKPSRTIDPIDPKPKFTNFQTKITSNPTLRNSASSPTRQEFNKTSWLGARRWPKFITRLIFRVWCSSIETTGAKINDVCVCAWVWFFRRFWCYTTVCAGKVRGDWTKSLAVCLNVRWSVSRYK